MEGNGDSKRKSCKEIEIENPFICDPSTYAENLYDKIKVNAVLKFIRQQRQCLQIILILRSWNFSFVRLIFFISDLATFRELSASQKLSDDS